MVTGAHLEPITQDECMALLSTASVGRIGVNIDALPTVLPVNFALFNGSVVFRTAPGTKLHFATRDAVVAFQADHYGSVREPTGWSVLVRGVAQTLTDPSVLRAAQHLPLEPWGPLEGSRGDYVRVEPAIVTGRRFVS
jgi:nitroimidazol reductase NimA-like FMN-containing flavoprotein (pyridoxamine 5'-phosphate oxidase superfamily)